MCSTGGLIGQCEVEVIYLRSITMLTIYANEGIPMFSYAVKKVLQSNTNRQSRCFSQSKAASKSVNSASMQSMVYLWKSNENVRLSDAHFFT